MKENLGDRLIHKKLNDIDVIVFRKNWGTIFVYCFFIVASIFADSILCLILSVFFSFIDFIGYKEIIFNSKEKNMAVNYGIFNSLICINLVKLKFDDVVIIQSMKRNFDGDLFFSLDIITNKGEKYFLYNIEDKVLITRIINIIDSLKLIKTETHK
jgi:hypothetical protein